MAGSAGVGGDSQSAREAHVQYMESWGPSIPEWLRIKHAALEKETVQWDYEGFRTYLKQYKRRGQDTIRKQLAQLRYMENHPEQPVRMQGSHANIVQSFWWYVKYREDVQRKEGTALKHDHTAIRSLGDYLGIPDNVWPVRPAIPRRAKAPLPMPEEIHSLIHHKFFDHRNPRAPLIKGLIVLCFLTGVRPMSEVAALRIDDYDPKNHTLLVREPKKGGDEHRLLLEPWLCCGRNAPSLNNYVTARNKVDVGESDAFILKADGTPFRSKDAIRTWWNKHIRPEFPEINPYKGRAWAATARLIEWDWDYYRVAQQLGHSNVEQLRQDYDRDSRLAYRQDGEKGNWLSRAARGPPTLRCKNVHRGERPRSGETAYSGLPLHPLRRNEGGSGGTCLIILLLARSGGIAILGLLIRAHPPESSESEVVPAFPVQVPGVTDITPRTDARPLVSPRVGHIHPPMIAST